jgi:hypothetical protein
LYHTDLTKPKGDGRIASSARGYRVDPCFHPLTTLKGAALMPRYDRLSILVSLVLFGLMVSHLIELPTRTVSFVALGVPTTIYISSRWFVGALLVAMTGAGADSVVRSHPLGRDAGWAYGLTFWALPCSLVLFAIMALPSSPSLAFWLGGLALTGVFLSLIVIAQYHTVNPGEPWAGPAGWVLSVATYVSVFVFCSLIYATRARSLLSATAIFLVGSGLAAELLRPNTLSTTTKRTWLYSLIVGLVLGEVAWALNHLSLGELASGIFFLLIFYVLTGLARQHLRGRLVRAVIVEFIVVSVLGLGLIYVL